MPLASLTSFLSRNAALAAALVAVSLILAPPVAHAQTTLVSNLDSGVVRGRGRPIGTSGVTNVQAAFAFTTGSTAYSLDAIQLYLGTVSVGTTSTLSLDLYTPSSGNPDAPDTLAVSLGSKTVTNRFSSPVLYTYAPSAAFVLAADTRYVALLDYVSGDTGIWNVSPDGAFPIARNDSGFSDFVYSASVNNGGSYNTANDVPLTISIDGTAVTAVAAAPEPGTIALLLTAGVPVVGRVRRRKNHA